jgi:hypothetical protein
MSDYFVSGGSTITARTTILCSYNICTTSSIQQQPEVPKEKKMETYAWSGLNFVLFCIEREEDEEIE